MELSKLIRDLKQVLYGDSESEPVAESCAQLTQEFFRENTLRLLITCLPKLNLEVLLGLMPNLVAINYQKLCLVQLALQLNWMDWVGRSTM